MDQNYDKADVVVAVHGFNPLAPEDPDTKDFKTVAQDRLREAYNEVQRQEEDYDVVFVITGGPYQDRLDDHLTENGHQSIEDHDLPSESELMKNQLEWMYTGHGDEEEGRLDAEETGLDNEHGEYSGSLDDIDADIILESESQTTEENTNYLLDIVKQTGASEIYAVTSKDHMPRSGYGNAETIEGELDGVKVRPVRSELAYAKGEDPGVVFGERGNKVSPVFDAVDEEVWGLFGESRDEIDQKAEEIRQILGN